MLLGHRYYDSSTGRFLTRDPIKDGRNWYVYCGSNPTGRADPTGLAFWIRNAGKAVYKIYEDTEDLLDHLIDVGRRGRDDRIDSGHRGGPTHGHDGKIHITDAASADKAPGPEWIKWREHSKYFPALAFVFAIATGDAMAAGEELGNIIDPAVQDAKGGYTGWTYGGRAGMDPDELMRDIFG